MAGQPRQLVSAIAANHVCITWSPRKNDVLFCSKYYLSISYIIPPVGWVAPMSMPGGCYTKHLLQRSRASVAGAAYVMGGLTHIGGWGYKPDKSSQQWWFDDSDARQRKGKTQASMYTVTIHDDIHVVLGCCYQLHIICYTFTHSVCDGDYFAHSPLLGSRAYLPLLWSFNKYYSSRQLCSK